MNKLRKQIICVAITAVTLSGAHASLPTGVNVLGNSGFEDATIAPWGAQNGAPSLSLSTNAQTGLQSAQVDFTADFHGIQQTLALDAGDALQEYTLTCSVNTEGYTDPFIVRLGLWEFTPSSGITFHDSAWVNVTPGSSGWVDLSYTVTLTAPTANALRSVVQCAPQGSPKLAGHFLVDDVSLIKAVRATPFPTIDTPNLIANGEFTQATNTVNGNPGFNDGFYTINGSLSDWTGFWGKFADLVDWTHYHADPNIPGIATEIGTTNNPSLVPDGAEFTLDGTDKVNTGINPDDGFLNLNSAGGYRNGMMQILSGATLNPEIIYNFAVEARATSGNDHDLATFTAGFTLGSGAASTNLANAVPGGLMQLSATNLPTGEGTYQTLQVSGADLLAGGQINLLVENVNTDPIPNFPNVLPEDVTGNANVSQVRLYSVSLTVPVVAGDLDKDGFVTMNDVDLANSYLDGSIDGGDDAVTRQDAEIANGNTAAEALALLNLVDFDIDGDDTFDAADVTAIEALVPPLMIESASADGSGNFNVDVSGMTPGATFYLKRSTDLVSGAFDTDVDTLTPASAAATMTDTNPPAGAAFYKVTD